MYLTKLRLRSIRGFQDLELDFRTDDRSLAGLHFILGVNGTGKSTILRGIALAIMGPKAGAVITKGWHNYVSNDAETGSIEATLQESPPASKPFKTRISLANESDGVSARGGPAGAARHGNHKGRAFAAGYGAFRRFGPQVLESRPSPLRLDRFITLFDDDESLRHAEAWLASLYTRGLEGDSEAALQHERVVELLRSDFLPGGLSVFRLDTRGLTFRTRSGSYVRLNQLSDGYRTATLLVLDLLRVLSSSLDGIPRMGPRVEGVGPYVDAPGIVLIDEIDAHLHPQWQQDIGPWLASRFPLTQFIVTTHSPLIAQSATGRIFHLEEGPDGRTVHPLEGHEKEQIKYGDVEEALTSEAFGLNDTRSEESRRLRRRFAALYAMRLREPLRAPEEQEYQWLLRIIRSSDSLPEGLVPEG